MMIFSGNSNQKLAEKIARILNLPLNVPEKFIFPDGEERIRILGKVVGEDVFLVAPLTPPVNEYIIETSFIVDGLKRSGASKVHLISPYLGYQRQDHIFRDGEAVSLEAVIKMLEAVGVDAIMAFDFHSIKIPEMFRIPVTHLSAMPLFAKTIFDLHFSKENTVLVSPDMGGIRRIKQFSKLLRDIPYATILKERDLATGSVFATSLELPNGLKELEGRDVIILDDMISGGGTMVKAVELLKANNAGKAYVFVTHAVFSQNAPVLLQESPIEKVFITDSVLVTKDKQFPKLEVLTISNIIAEEIKAP